MGREKTDMKVFIAWAVIMVAGAMLLFTGIARESLWYDESYSAAMTKHTLGEIIDITGGDSHPPLYYLMLRIFSMIFGNSVLSLRAFSALGALALAALGIGPVRRALGNATGLAFTLLTFALPITVAMAQEARMYTWAAFFVTGSTLYGYLSYRDGRTKDWILFAVCSLAAAYIHYYGLLAVAAVTALLLIMMIKGRKKVLPFLAAAGAMAGGYMPWIIKLAGQVSRVSGDFWIEPVTWQVIKKVFIYPFSNKFSNPASEKLVAAGFLLAAAVILWGIVSRIVRKDKDAGMPLLAAGAYILTIAGGVIASWTIRPVLVERYMIPVLGLFILAVACGAASLGKRIPPIIACAVLLAISVPQIHHTMTNIFNGPMNDAVSRLKPEIKPDDVFLHTDEHTLGTFCYYFPDNLSYYYEREGYGGFSNYDAFKPNGFLLDELDEIGKDRRIFLVQRFNATDNVSASEWLSSGRLRPDGAPALFQIPTSWYGFSIRRVSISEPGDMPAYTADGSGDLLVAVSGLRSNNGSVVVNLYIQDPMTGAPLMQQAGEIRDGQAEVVFKDIPFGDYAALAFHDENGNQEVDMNNNIPTEGLGYSNMFDMPQGPPEFDKCRFSFNGGSLDILVFYIPQ
jgi:uncharacterized protein (DUF2141 family)